LLESPEKLAQMKVRMGQIMQKLGCRRASEAVAAVVGGYLCG
jgi:hypothetical protein